MWRREATRPLLPQHARHCPVLEAGSTLGVMVYPPLEAYESFHVGFYGEGRYQFVYSVLSPTGEWLQIFIVRTSLPVGGIGSLAHEVEIVNKQVSSFISSNPVPAQPRYFAARSDKLQFVAASGKRLIGEITTN